LLLEYHIPKAVHALARPPMRISRLAFLFWLVIHNNLSDFLKTYWKNRSQQKKMLHMAIGKKLTGQK